ncbi:DUF4412 domain-containing protein [Altibacter sp. HG106]|uniref:DUF4412 domain-containing protein n=1 Tax=Altibacter sp. HG106 TaxID=3023937 RepID=UPI00234FBA04|nr:DUF4412 domain-containing protein [Altibacter sp. HG106]MDC7993903.1 DUF4412 domain-containing protein [Altibacter sp. HG106]
MKRTKLLIVALLIMAPLTQINAQFFKKLTKSVERSVENTIERKVSNKAAEKTGEAVDEVLEEDETTSTKKKRERRSSSTMPIGMGGMEAVPAVYDFEWVYRLKMVSPRSRNNMEMEYYLKKDAAYWGAQFYQDGESVSPSFMVYDTKINKMVMFMDQGGTKMAMATKLPKGIVDAATEESDYEDYTIKEIPGKTILGYDCEGYQMENEEYKYVMYITFDAPVSFTDMFGSDKMPEDFNPDWLMKGDVEGMMMEMDMDDKNSSRNDMKMSCVALEKKDVTIRKSDFQ